MTIGQRQRLGHLRFCLYNRPLHPELFDIHHDHRIAKARYEAQVWITGCSHVIGFYHGKTSLVEVTADIDTDLPQQGLLVEFPLRGEQAHEHRSPGGVIYMMNFQVETMRPAVYAQTHQELAEQAERRGLYVPFPMWAADALTPFAYVDYQAKPNELHVFTFHALAGDLTMVKTQSIFELT